MKRGEKWHHFQGYIFAIKYECQYLLGGICMKSHTHYTNVWKKRQAFNLNETQIRNEGSPFMHTMLKNAPEMSKKKCHVISHHHRQAYLFIHSPQSSQSSPKWILTTFLGAWCNMQNNPKPLFHTQFAIVPLNLLKETDEPNKHRKHMDALFDIIGLLLSPHFLNVIITQLLQNKATLHSCWQNVF